MAVEQLERQPETEDILSKDPVEAAKAAGLHYVSDAIPGIRREKVGDEFQYFGPKGKQITNPDELKRLKSLGIPPAYTEVWICPDPNGHLQATARDAKGRKQYRYHKRWREIRDENKYERMIAFGQALPTIRDRIAKDMCLAGLPRQKVLATVVKLLEMTLIRVGNEEYARENKSFGLTTMRDRHVKIEGSEVQFHFKGKSGKTHTISIKDRKLAGIVKRCRDIPGYELFQYIDEDGTRQTIDSADVNAYLQEITGQEFTAKDFRTWAGTTVAAMALQEFGEFDTKAQAKKNVVQAIEQAAKRLGNTPAICRKCYVHPAVIESYLVGSMLEALKQRAEETLADSLHALSPEEAAVIGLLQQRLAQETKELA